MQNASAAPSPAVELAAEACALPALDQELASALPPPPLSPRRNEAAESANTQLLAMKQQLEQAQRVETQLRADLSDLRRQLHEKQDESEKSRIAAIQVAALEQQSLKENVC